MKFTIFQESRIGKRRANQDRLAYSYSRDSLLMVVADGMGGHLNGEVAAQVAVQCLIGVFERESKPRLPDPAMFLSWGMAAAHRAIGEYAAEHGLPESPRTTCVACVVQDGFACWAHAGDSRLYLIRDGAPLARTHDHSRVQAMIDQGLLSEAEARCHPARNRVYSCLGGEFEPQIDFSPLTPVEPGDVIALCSDGVWGPLDELLLVRTLAKAKPLDAVPQLLNKAETQAGEASDNLSLIAMNWEGDSDTDTLPLDTVETRTMPIEAHTTRLEGFDAERARQSELSEDEIERAVEEIRGAIRKYSR